MNRRSFLKVFGAGVAASAVSAPLMRALANTPTSSKDCFIIVHASGGWDVTIWADPRNEARGLIDPASDEVLDPTGVRHWQNKPLAGGAQTFDLVQRRGFALGPAFGGMIDRFDRATIINGISMDTVSHTDGTFYSATGRHLAGGRPLQSSIDSVLASEVGAGDLLPLVSVGFPSAFLGGPLDARATPLRMARVTDAGKSLRRSELRTQAVDRAGVHALLANEAAELAHTAHDPLAAESMRLQYTAVDRMLNDESLLAMFDDAELRTKLQPRFFADANGTKIARRFHDALALECAFAVEAIKQGSVRCVSCRAGSFDMHFGTSYQTAGIMFQDFFDVLALLVDRLDAEGLSDRVHVLVVSDFCRTPQITARGGRDHYPNNSALVISPRFKGGLVFGETDRDQLLPKNVLSSPLGPRPVRPSDVLATFLTAMGIDPRRHLRDGEAIPAVLK